MYALKANFYPAKEPKNGYLGKAVITIANAVAINKISVFQGTGGPYIRFGGWGDEGREYVVPHTAEARAAMVDVVAKAMEAKDHVAEVRGDYGPQFTASGVLVDEKYADGRFSVNVGDLCTLHGITTRWRSFEKDGKKQSFVAVNMPTVNGDDGKALRFTNAAGHEEVRLQFNGLVSTWKDKDGEENSINYAVRMKDAVRECRKKLREEKKNANANKTAG